MEIRINIYNKDGRFYGVYELKKEGLHIIGLAAPVNLLAHLLTYYLFMQTHMIGDINFVKNISRERG